MKRRILHKVFNSGVLILILLIACSVAILCSRSSAWYGAIAGCVTGIMLDELFDAIKKKITRE